MPSDPGFSFLRLKDIASRMDDCHPRTATRWWKKLDRQCRAAGLPGVAPDVTGHGAHKWRPETAARLLKLWGDYYRQRASEPRKFVEGLKPDGRQLDFYHELLTAPPRPAPKALRSRRVRPDARKA